MSLEVAINNNQTKRPNPKYTLEFKQGAAKIVNGKGHAHQRAGDNLGVSLGAVGRWPGAARPCKPIRHQDGSLEPDWPG
jgi:hypothetical protein